MERFEPERLADRRTRHADTRTHRQRPSLVAIVMMLAATWAVVATSPPVTSEEESSNVGWTATSESGVEPVISLVGLESTLATGSGDPLTSVDIAASDAELELSVTNIDATGPVTIEWRASTSIEGDVDDLSLTASAGTGQPSPLVSLCPLTVPPASASAAP